jgi:hypothetical protein
MPIHTCAAWQTRLPLVALIVSIAACGGGVNGPVASPSPIPTAPAGPTPASSSTSSVVTWTIMEFTATGGRRPVPNLRLRVREASASNGAVGGAELPDITTDVSGRFETPATSLLLFVATAQGSDYRFPCDFFPLDNPQRRGGPPLPVFFYEIPVLHVSWVGRPVAIRYGVMGHVDIRNRVRTH